MSARRMTAWFWNSTASPVVLPFDALLDVTLPVFLVIGFGYAAVRSGAFPDASVDGLMRFAQGIAIPFLLFRAISTLDLQQTFQWPLLLSFYSGATAGFVTGIAGARILFRRPWADSVAIGFCCLFSNSVLLGLPITERAYGSSALATNYAIIAIHAPFCYALGITTMEIVRHGGGGLLRTIRAVIMAMVRNALMVGIAAGFAVNLGGIHLPAVMTEAVDLVVRAALPAALFGLGGILVRYRPEGDMKTVLFVSAVALMLHPAITWSLGTGLSLDQGQMRSAVVTAAMAPGVNAYLFANMYGVAKRVAATSVLVATALSILTATFWLSVLG